MTTTRTILSAAVLLFAAYIAVMNWGCVIVSARNKRKGIDRHHSTVPVVTLILAGLAYALWPYTPKLWIATVPVVDIANWTLLWFPIVLIRSAKSKKRSEGINRPQ